MEGGGDRHFGHARSLNAFYCDLLGSIHQTCIGGAAVNNQVTLTMCSKVVMVVGRCRHRHFKTYFTSINGTLFNHSLHSFRHASQSSAYAVYCNVYCMNAVAA